MFRFMSSEVGSFELKIENKEPVRNCEAEAVKKIKNFRLKAIHKVPYKKNLYTFL